MILRASGDEAKGWLAGPWDSTVPCAVGFANEGVQANHRHHDMYEVYLVARGTSVAEVNGAPVDLRPGDMLCVEPGEQHTWRSSSDDYFHFVIQTPFVKGDKEDL